MSAAAGGGGDNSYGGSASSGQLHGVRTSPLENSRSNRGLSRSTVAQQEEQQQAWTMQSSLQPDFVTPSITVTEPECGDEASEAPDMQQKEGEEEERAVGREKGRDGKGQAVSPPISTSARAGPGGWQGRLLATVIVDQPIPEENEDEEVNGDDEKRVTEERTSVMQAESRWAHVRSGAHSYPTHSSGSTLQAMLQPPNPQPLLTEKEREQVREIPSATATDTSSKGSGGESTMFNFVQMALMAKKWKTRSTNERTSPRTSGETLYDRQRRRPLVELPRCLKMEVLEEAHHIVHKTLQRYRSELGLRHKLTLQAEQHCETLEQQLGHTHHSAH